MANLHIFDETKLQDMIEYIGMEAWDDLDTEAPLVKSEEGKIGSSGYPPDLNPSRFNTDHQVTGDMAPSQSHPSYENRMHYGNCSSDNNAMQQNTQQQPTVVQQQQQQPGVIEQQLQQVIGSQQQQQRIFLQSALLQPHQQVTELQQQQQVTELQQQQQVTELQQQQQVTELQQQQQVTELQQQQQVTELQQQQQVTEFQQTNSQHQGITVEQLQQMFDKQEVAALQQHQEHHNTSGALNEPNLFLRVPSVGTKPPEDFLDLNPLTPPPSAESTETPESTEGSHGRSVTPALIQPVAKQRIVVADGNASPDHVNQFTHQPPVLHVTNSQQQSNTIQILSSNRTVSLNPHQQQQSPVSMTQHQQIHTVPVTQKAVGVDVPALTDMEGEYGFTVTVEEKELTTKSPMWLMSKITKKLYTNINKSVPFEIHLKKKLPNDQFHVRAVAVFSSAQFLRTNVTRCPNHAATSDNTNHDFPYPTHVVRADHPEAQYDESSNGRLSVVVPLDVLQDGSEFTPILLRFMCLGSCVGGINRRPIAIILSLENDSGQTVGRKVIHVRVCACPTRDIKTEELNNRGILKRKGSTHQEKPLVSRKKPKHTEPKIEPEDDEDQIYHLPIRGKRLFIFMTRMKQVYYETHPEYASKYQDDLRLPGV